MSPTKGNIDLRIKKPINNKDGSISTVRTIGIEADGMYINIPTVIGGKIVSNEEAINYYRKTGKDNRESGAGVSLHVPAAGLRRRGYRSDSVRLERSLYRK